MSLSQRFAENPILRPRDVKPTQEGWVIECLLNPGALTYKGRIGLLLRVAERPAQEKGWISTPIVDPESQGGVRIVRFRTGDPEVITKDPRVIKVRGQTYLTTLSHLRLAWSDDGRKFTVEDAPTIVGEPVMENFGVEDCRVTQIGDAYYLTYTQVSPHGVCVGLISTHDWKTFDRRGTIFPPANKDCAIFPEPVGGYYFCLHRPSSSGIGGNYIWTAKSPDLVHWGDHRCIARTRPELWDSARVGAGADPIRTPQGWLTIYHGADKSPRYCLGLLLMDLSDPSKVLARSIEPIMVPEAPYELTGFFGNVVFTNGHVVRGDEILMYYGASDEVICGARLSVSSLLNTLR